ncbi:hypothetical protein N9W84_00855 [bacterium]|nr:hypothetical protein [bacterium]
MNDIYALKIRHGGDEDVIALYITREEAEAAVYAFFGLDSAKYKTIDDVEEYLFDTDIGYFEIYTFSFNRDTKQFAEIY